MGAKSLADSGIPPRVSVIVPARNEQDNIAACVASLLAQGPEIEIIVAEDNSEDATAQIVRQVVTGHPEVKLLSAPPVPQGWLGKPHAMAVAAEQARGKWLLFTDADTRHAPARLHGAIDLAESEGCDLLSFSPRQETRTWWEKAVIPQVYQELARLYPYERVNDPADPLAAANGQYLLIRREVYLALGGHTAARGAVLDDVELARRAKQAGYRIRFGSGEKIVTTRMYSKFPEMWRGWTKNLFLLYDRNCGAIVRAVLRRAARHLLPAAAVLLLVVSGLRWGAGASLVPLAFLAVEHYRYGRDFPAGEKAARTLFLLVGSVLFLLLLLNSTRHYRGRKEFLWKGRRYRAVA